VNYRRTVFSGKLKKEVFMKSLPKRRNGNKGRHEREREKLCGLGNLFRSEIKTNLLKNASKKKKLTFYFLIPGVGFIQLTQKIVKQLPPKKNNFVMEQKT
jgi:hypothetical protein